MVSCQKAPSALTGTISQIHEDGTFLIDIDEEDENNKDYDFVLVPVNDLEKDTYSNFMIGDHVLVSYNGKILDKACGVVDRVFGIEIED